jgi:hypothetical protein
LPNITAQVKDEIRDGVILFRRPPPDLLGRKTIKTLLNPSFKLLQLVHGKADEESIHSLPPV